MTLEEFNRLIEANFGPTEGGMLGELVATVENRVAGGSNLPDAIYNAAQEMRGTLADIQRLGADDLAAEDTAELGEALDEEAGDDCCDNCLTSGVACSQTCPDCGAVLCAECGAENDGLCAECVSSADDEAADELDTDGDGDEEEQDETGHVAP